MVFFFVKTDNPRPTFQSDMTPQERATMTRHVEYWSGYAKRGKAVVFGPVADPKGVYGILVANVEDEEELKRLLAVDPAKDILVYSYHMMPRAVTERMMSS